MSICTTLYWTGVQKYCHSLPSSLKDPVKPHNRLVCTLVPVVEVHYGLQSVSSSSRNVSFKSWQKRYHNIHPVSLAFPVKVRCTEIHQNKTKNKKTQGQFKWQPSSSLGFKDWVNGLPGNILSPFSAWGGSGELEARSCIQAINSQPEQYAQLGSKVGTVLTFSLRHSLCKIKFSVRKPSLDLMEVGRGEWGVGYNSFKKDVIIIVRRITLYPQYLAHSLAKSTPSVSNCWVNKVPLPRSQGKKDTLDSVSFPYRS